MNDKNLTTEQNLIMNFLYNHRKSSIVGLAEYLSKSIEETVLISKRLQELNLVKIYTRSDDLLGVKPIKENLYTQQEMF